MYRTNFGGNGYFVSESHSLDEVVRLAEAIIEKENIGMVVEPFACGSSLLSNALFPQYGDKLIFHLTDIKMDIHIPNAVSAKVDYESLIPWLLDKKAFIYCDPPHENFDLQKFYTLMDLLQYQNYVIIRSKLLPPPDSYKEFWCKSYMKEDSLLDKWVKENDFIWKI